MTIACDETFAIVDVIRNDRSIRTRGVDAFALAIIRSERQIRRIVTYLAFQASALTRKDVEAMKTLMAARRGLYFSNFMRAFEQLGLPSISVVVENFEVLSTRMAEATRYRNKIFHGQLTGDSLDTERLLSLEADIRAWCKSLAVGADARFGYDGFSGFTSFFKGGRTELVEVVDVKLRSLDDYDGLLRGLERLR